MTGTALVGVYTCPGCGHQTPEGKVRECEPGCRFIPGDAKETTYDGKFAPNHFCRGWNPKRNKYCGARAGAATEHPGAGRCKKHGGTSNITAGRRINGTGRYSGLKLESIREGFERHAQDPEPLNQLAELAAARALFEDWINRYTEWAEALLAWYASFQESGRPISADRLHCLNYIVDEYEDLVVRGYEEEDEARTDGELRIKQARELLDVLAAPVEGMRPRKIMDIAIARQLLDSINTQIANIKMHEEKMHISRRDFYRVMAEMGLSVQRRNTITDPDQRLQAIMNDWNSIGLPR